MNNSLKKDISPLTKHFDGIRADMENKLNIARENSKKKKRKAFKNRIAAFLLQNKGSIAIVFSIILAAILYYEANRYEYSGGRVIDKYHGTYKMATKSK